CSSPGSLRANRRRSTFRGKSRRARQGHCPRAGCWRVPVGG
ncbi:MAG: hypothetical protein AVDCRST_MAG59-3659, partial [uncultured Thermomicrobiales bacterium]